MSTSTSNSVKQKISKRTLTEVLDILVGSSNANLQMSIKFERHSNEEGRGILECNSGFWVSRCIFPAEPVEFKNVVSGSAKAIKAFCERSSVERISISELSSAHKFQAGKASFTINFHESEEEKTSWSFLDMFPRQLIFERADDVAEYAKQMSKVAEVAANEILKGISIQSDKGKVKFTSSDAHRIFQSEVLIESSASSGQVSAIIPASAFAILGYFNGTNAQLSIGIKDNKFLLEIIDPKYVLQIHGGCIDAKYPNLSKVMEKVPTLEYRVDLEKLDGDLRLHESISKDSHTSSGVFTFGTDILRIESNGRDVVTKITTDDGLVVEGFKEDIQLGFKLSYILSALAFILFPKGKGKVSISIADGKKALWIRQAEELPSNKVYQICVIAPVIL